MFLLFGDWLNFCFRRRWLGLTISAAFMRQKRKRHTKNIDVFRFKQTIFADIVRHPT